MDFISSYAAFVERIMVEYVILLFLAVVMVVLVGALFGFCAAAITEKSRNIRISVAVGVILSLPIAIDIVVKMHDNFVKRNAKIATTVNGQSEIDRFIVVNMNPPKHFYVTLKSVRDGLVYGPLYVSKHCNKHAQIADGDEVNVRIHKQWHTDDARVKIVFENLNEVFCV